MDFYARDPVDETNKRIHYLVNQPNEGLKVGHRVEQTPPIGRGSCIVVIAVFVVIVIIMWAHSEEFS